MKNWLDKEKPFSNTRVKMFYISSTFREEQIR